MNIFQMYHRERKAHKLADYLRKMANKLREQGVTAANLTELLPAGCEFWRVAAKDAKVTPPSAETVAIVAAILADTEADARVDALAATDCFARFA